MVLQKVLYSNMIFNIVLDVITFQRKNFVGKLMANEDKWRLSFCPLIKPVLLYQHRRFNSIQFKRKISPFYKYMVFHGYSEDIHVVVTSISPIFPIFPSILIPFSLIRNQIIYKVVILAVANYPALGAGVMLCVKSNPRSSNKPARLFV